MIAAVNGFALGGGCETAMACTSGWSQRTLNLDSLKSRWESFLVAVGRNVCRGRSVGRALQVIFSGGMINAQEAYRIGLVNEVVPVTDLIPRAEAILNQIFKNAPIAVKYSLEAVNKGLETSVAEGLSLEASLFGICAGTEDKNEGTQAFLQKRPANFKGK